MLIPLHNLLILCLLCANTSSLHDDTSLYADTFLYGDFKNRDASPWDRNTLKPDSEHVDRKDLTLDCFSEIYQIGIRSTETSLEKDTQ